MHTIAPDQKQIVNTVRPIPNIVKSIITSKVRWICLWNPDNMKIKNI